MHLKVAIFALAAVFISPSSSFFRLPCSAPVVVQRADPIANPGSLAQHVHTVMGGNGFGFEMDYRATQASTCSSCLVTKDMSNYWVPTLYYRAKNGSFTSVEQNGGMTVYYLQRDDSRDPGFLDGLHAFPPGFTMLAGDQTLRSYVDSPEQNAINYACLGSKTPETNGFPKIKCPGGLRAQVFFPSCWDGVVFEPKDQQMHLSYPSGVDNGYCSPPFTKRLISIFYEVIWNTFDFDDEWYDDSQPFVWSNGDPTGYGYHGDFFNGWHVPTLQKAIDTCHSDSGDIGECKALDLLTSKEAEACKIPVSVNETVSGILDSLPGCNPIQNGPDRAVPQHGCGAPTFAGDPNLSFTDVTHSRRFKYVGCGLDIAGKPRTLLGDGIKDGDGMTIERCIDYCNAQGFTIAGLEFSKECYCGNSIPDDRLPLPGRLGDCNMPCTGDEKQKCGGAGLISLYEKCGDTCFNAPILFINGSHGTGAPIATDFYSTVTVSPVSGWVQNAAGNAAGVKQPPSHKAKTTQGHKTEKCKSAHCGSLSRLKHNRN